MDDTQRIRFAKMKLVNSTRRCWHTVTQNITYLGQTLVSHWDEMKEQLKEKYLS